MVLFTQLDKVIMKTTTINNTNSNASISPLVIHNGTVEGLKWLALVIMTLDHINKFFYNETLPGVFQLGRIAMPIFAFVLAYNLARPNAFESGLYQRVMKRLALYGAISLPACFFLMGKAALGFPANIMFMLLVSTATLFFIQKKDASSAWYAILIFSLGSIFVEYWWFGVMICIASFYYCKKPSFTNLFLILISLVFVLLVNVNLWAVAALPVILYAKKVALPIPRVKNLFYAYYPIHLSVIAAILYMTR